jgi:2,3-bisphosphoglycerate-independent phosphoglycerate mutase
MKPVILIVLDGFGVAPPGPGNAIQLANPENFNSFLHNYPNTTLKASGEAVGLPEREAGNTEVGHINMGAGRVVYQDLPRINMSVADGSFYQNAAFNKAIEHVQKTGGKLHFIGLIGQGSVHSHIDHLHALMHLVKEKGVQKAYIHAITDGRDSPPKSAEQFIAEVEKRMTQTGMCYFASIIGRYFAMDRDRRWDRTEKAYNCLTKGEGSKANTIREAIAASYQAGKTDEFIEPTLLKQLDGSYIQIQKGDSVIFFNYRIDRPRQLTKAFVLDDFQTHANLIESFDPYEVKYHHSHLQAAQDLEKQYPIFQRGEKITDLCFVTMTEYEKNLPADVAFPQIVVSHPIGRVIADQGMYQLRMSESEKERFVTFYFNGQRDIPFPQSDRVIVASPKVATYDLKPEMSAYELTDSLISYIHMKRHQFILINYANSDMVGHTGNIKAAIRAIEVLDECLGKVVEHALDSGYAVFITADHGNAEMMIDPTSGQIRTEHTNNPVPFVAISSELNGKNLRLQTGVLADVAPTILAMMGLEKPPDMTGRNLLLEVSTSEHGGI